VWTKSADEILETLAAYCKRINDSGHEPQPNALVIRRLIRDTYRQLTTVAKSFLEAAAQPLAGLGELR
jgi:hypothetical protein